MRKLFFLTILILFIVPIKSQAITIIDGDLIRASGDLDVYIVKLAGDPSTGSGQVKKFKRLILNPEIFNQYGHLKWENIKSVEQEVIDEYAVSDLVRAVDDQKVYKLYPDGDIGEKRWIKTADDFLDLGYDWDAIYEINSYERDYYSAGEDIEAIARSSDVSGPAPPEGHELVTGGSHIAGRKILLMGSKNNEISIFKFTGGNEAMNIEKFSVATSDPESGDNFSGIKLKYQTEAQWGSSEWTISPTTIFGAVASRAFNFSDSNRPYIPRKNDAYIVVLADIAEYKGGAGAKSKKPIMINYVDGSQNSFVAYGASSGYKYTSLTGLDSGDLYLHFIARSKPVFAKKDWADGETELARFTITAEGHDVIFQPDSSLLAFEMIASPTDGALTSFYLYDWNENIISSAESINTYSVNSIDFNFEYTDRTITIPKGQTKEFHIDIGGEDLVDFDHTDEYIYFKLRNDDGDDLATGDFNLKKIIYYDGTTGERYGMPQDVTNIGPLPLIFRTLRGTNEP